MESAQVIETERHKAKADTRDQPTGPPTAVEEVSPEVLAVQWVTVVVSGQVYQPVKEALKGNKYKIKLHVNIYLSIHTYVYTYME